MVTQSRFLVNCRTFMRILNLSSFLHLLDKETNTKVTKNNPNWRITSFVAQAWLQDPQASMSILKLSKSAVKYNILTNLCKDVVFKYSNIIHITFVISIFLFVLRNFFYYINIPYIRFFYACIQFPLCSPRFPNQGKTISVNLRQSLFLLTK